MIQTIINFLLIPFKVKYVKQTPFSNDKEFNKKWSFKSYYNVYINVGTLLKPVWYGNQYSEITHFKRLYSLYKATYRVYKQTEYNKIKN